MLPGTVRFDMGQLEHEADPCAPLSMRPRATPMAARRSNRVRADAHLLSAAGSAAHCGIHSGIHSAFTIFYAVETALISSSLIALKVSENRGPATMAKPEISASNKHIRAICDEIGDRLRHWLNGTAQTPSARLTAVLRHFEKLEQMDAPSIVPSLEAADEYLRTD